MTDKDIHRDDQMNLSALAFLVKSSLRGFFRFLSFSVVVIRKWKFIVLAGLFLGLFTAMFYYYLAQTKYFQASVMVAYTQLPPRTYAGIIDQLNVLARSGSTDRLAHELNVEKRTASSLVFLEARNTKNEELEFDTATKREGTFKLTFGVRSYSAADSLQDALINYINGLPYLQTLWNVQRENNREKMDRLESDLIRLDSLKQTYNRFLSSSRVSTTVYNDAIDPAKLYTQTSITLQDLSEARRAFHADSAAVSILDPAKLAVTTRSKPLSNLLLLIGLAGMFAGYLVGLMIELRKYVMP
jgi:uncharacterized protein involved in exopolysaccharide biosynthesis